jgi:hypothetical protein
MFGKGKQEEETRLVGAKEKIQKAQARAALGAGDDIEGKSEGKKDHAVVIVLIYILAASLAFVRMMGGAKEQSFDLHTGFPALDRILFSSGTPSVLGSPDQDFIVVPLIRGLAIFIVVGFLPLLTLVWIKIINKPKTNPYIALWSVSLGFFLAVFVVKDCLLPLFVH